VINYRVSTILNFNLLLSGAICIALASSAFAATDPKKENPTSFLTVSDPKVIGSSNTIQATMDNSSGLAVTPGFKTVGTSAIFAGDPVGVVNINTNKLGSAVSSSSFAGSGLLVTPGTTSVPTSSLISGNIQASGAMISQHAIAPASVSPTCISISSSFIASTPPAYIIPAASAAQTTYHPGINAPNNINFASDSKTENTTLAASSPAINASNKTSSSRELFAAMAKSAASEYLRNSFNTYQKEIASGLDRNINVLGSQAKQISNAAKIIFKHAQSLTAKTASSVIDGFYVAKENLSTKRVTVAKQIKLTSNVRKIVSEQSSGWIKGIIPVFKIAIPNEQLPLFMQIYILDSNTMPGTSTAGQHKDPLSPPIRKIVTDSANGDPIPGSAIQLRKALQDIHPTHIKAFFDDILRKSAVNYAKTGLSPPQTVSTISTALLPASDPSLRIWLSPGASAYRSKIKSYNSFNYSYISSYFSHYTRPLSLLVSGGDQFKGQRTFILCLHTDASGSAGGLSVLTIDGTTKNLINITN
jgi:hypothetical protein